MTPFLFTAALAALAAAAPAMAQVSALKGLDTNAPIDVDAARIELQDSASQAVFSGDVVIRQGKLTLYADSVKVLYARNGNDTQMQRLDARGNVRLVSPSEKASSNLAIYDVKGRIITMTGNVTLDRGGSQLQGQRLVLNLATGQSSFDGRGGAAAKPGAPAGRVTGRFTVPARKP
jgi:lipopolysaccharide export system protein LptA